MDDTPYVNDGADASLRKTVSLLNKIEAKTGSATITGPVTVTNEVEIKNDANNPLPVSDNGGSLTVDGTVELGATSLSALENIQVTFPSTQNVNVTNAGLNVSVSNLPALSTGTNTIGSVNVLGGNAAAVKVDGSAVTQPVSIASAPVTPVTDNGGSLTVDGTVTVNDMTSGNAKTKIVDSTGADVSYIPAGTAGTPSSSVLSVQGISGGTVIGIDSNHVGDGIQAYLNDHGNDIPVSNQSITNIDADLGATTDSAATTDTGTFSAIALIKRGLQNWTSLLAKIPALVSGRIPVDGSGVTQPVSGTFFQATQPTRETQPIGDYVINVGAAGTLSLSGSAVSTPSFDAGATADYIAVTIEGGGASGGFYIDGSTDNSSWTSGQYLNVYYDVPSISGTDAYSYRTVSGQLFGATRYNYFGRFIVSCTQGSAFATANIAFRYFRITTPATYGSWRYKFASYKSPVYSIGGTNPGGVTRVNGRVDVGYVSNLPTLTATVTQATSSNLKGQAQILNSAGSLITYAESGTYGSPSVDVISVQNPQGTSAAIATFTSTTASTSLVSAATARKTLTVYNSGPGDLNISPTATCTTSNFQIRLASNDYWECPNQQVTMAHTAVFSSAGTAYVTTIS